MGNLNDRHRKELESSGLTAETIKASGCYSASAEEGRKLVGYSVGAGLAFPYLHTSQNGTRPYARLKPDEPFAGKDGERAKYVSPRRATNPDGNRLYISANLPEGVLDDPSVPLIVTEGEKKSLAGNQEGFATVGLAGVACWVSRNGNAESHPIADLDLVKWEGRRTYIAFDSDATTKDDVKREERKLAAELRRRGANVWIVRLPGPKAAEDLENGLRGKFGMDDFLRVRGKSAFAALLESARQPTAKSASSERPPSADLAEEFLQAKFAGADGMFTLRWWREQFYRFVGSHYEPLPDGDLRAQINRWLQTDGDCRGAAGTRVTTAIIQNIEAMTIIESGREPPMWLDGRGERQEYLALENGIISVEELLQGDLDALQPHTPAFFTLGALPFPLRPEGDCPRWLRFLDEMLPDPRMRQLVQEMFGYLLVHDVSQEKFFLFEGGGANGKTVVCTVLREILGATNVCGVNLEAFSATRTFPLAATIGKKANIVEELDEISKAAEGTLKNFVTGKPMSIERKNVDAFEFTPTARLVFATNVLPRFVDRTDGLWRRMILIPLREQILDEAKQDKRLIDPAWWRASGELPGILLWAVGGLASLRKRGHFEEPEVCRAEKAAYRKQSNPAGTFLEENCRAVEEVETPSPTLYRAYVRWCDDNGHRHPLSSQMFAREVRHAFPTVQATQHPKTVGEKRERVWIGLELVS